jgi:hypothetical protein
MPQRPQFGQRGRYALGPPNLGVPQSSGHNKSNRARHGGRYISGVRFPLYNSCHCSEKVGAPAITSDQSAICAGRPVSSVDSTNSRRQALSHLDSGRHSPFSLPKLDLSVPTPRYLLPPSDILRTSLTNRASWASRLSLRIPAALPAASGALFRSVVATRVNKQAAHPTNPPYSGPPKKVASPKYHCSCRLMPTGRRANEISAKNPPRQQIASHNDSWIGPLVIQASRCLRITASRIATGALRGLRWPF